MCSLIIIYRKNSLSTNCYINPPVFALADKD